MSGRWEKFFQLARFVARAWAAGTLALVLLLLLTDVQIPPGNALKWWISSILAAWVLLSKDLTP